FPPPARSGSSLALAQQNLSREKVRTTAAHAGSCSFGDVLQNASVNVKVALEFSLALPARGFRQKVCDQIPLPHESSPPDAFSRLRRARSHSLRDRLLQLLPKFAHEHAQDFRQPPLTATVTNSAGSETF